MGIQNLKCSLRRSLCFLSSVWSPSAVAVAEFVCIFDTCAINTSRDVVHLQGLLEWDLEITVLIDHPLTSRGVAIHDLIANLWIRGDKGHGGSLLLNRIRNGKSGGKLLPHMVELTALHNVSSRLALVEPSIRKQVGLLLARVCRVQIRQ